MGPVAEHRRPRNVSLRFSVGNLQVAAWRGATVTRVSNSDLPFADWDELVAFVRANWTLEAIDEHGEWFERVWQWADRSQQVTFERVEYRGDIWISWAAAVADESTMTDAQLVEATAGEMGRIIRFEGSCWLEQHIPLALLSPRLFEHYSDSFAKRADDLEREITGGADRD